MQIAAGDPPVGARGALGPPVDLERRAGGVGPQGAAEMDLIGSSAGRAGDVVEIDLPDGLLGIEAGLDIEQAKLNLGFTEIRSELDGVAGFANREIGDLVGPLDSKSLTTVSTVDPIKSGTISFGDNEDTGNSGVETANA